MRTSKDVSISHDFLTPEVQEFHAHETRSSTRVVQTNFRIELFDINNGNKYK
jgi:hypothetical protein